MTNEQTLTGFLLARIAEDEATTARIDCVCEDNSPTEWQAGCPDRVLAECEAKRRIVDLLCHTQTELRDTETPGRYDRVLVHHPYEDEGEQVIAQLAAVYSDHPDYRAEWAA